MKMTGHEMRAPPALLGKDCRKGKRVVDRFVEMWSNSHRGKKVKVDPVWLSMR